MSNDFLQDLASIEKEKLAEGGYVRGELTKIFQDIADKYNQSPTVIKNNYYRHIKGKVEKRSFEVYKTYKIENKEIRSIYDESDELEYIVVDDVLRFTGKNHSTQSILKTVLNKKVVSIFGENEPLLVMEKENFQSFLSSMSEYVSDEAMTKKVNQVKQLLTNEVKKSMSEKSIDDSIAAYLEQTAYRPTYRYGDIVKVRIIKMLPYGVIAQIIEYPEMQGLIHISEVRNGFVEDVSLYFEEGDELEAKVISGLRDGKISFSTKGMKLPLKTEKKQENEPVPSYNSMSPKLMALKEELEQTTAENEPVPEEEPEELKEIVAYLNGIVGALSPNAKEGLKEIVDSKGVFKFTIAMTEVAKNFQNDLGLLFIKEVQKKMSDSL